MAHTLVIIESPGKKKKLEQILGDAYIVRASFGHVRDLPAKEIGIAPPHFRPTYVVGDDRAKRTIAELKKAASTASRVLLATDPDREGEAIAWHVAEVIKLKKPERISYTEITEPAVRAAIASPRPIDMQLVHAQEARRSLDRIVGYTVSPALSNATGQHLSAGRVQTPAVRLVVERERAIRAFEPTHHFGAELRFDGAKEWTARWTIKPHLEPGAEYMMDEDLAKAAAAVRNVRVIDIANTTKPMAPPAPFTTSTLQQAAQSKLKLKPQQTMQIAQKLYEQGAISYMRTDSPNLSETACAAIAAYAAANGLPLAPKRRTWKAKGSAQEAHEAIRPTHIEETAAGGTDQEQALYRLIWSRAVASQLADATYAERTVALEDHARTYHYTGKGRTLLDKGWRVLDLSPSDEDDEDGSDEDVRNPVPMLTVGTELVAIDGNLISKTTEPPRRYTLATLVRDLEAHGIGRPATYASILENISTRGYIVEDNKGRLSASAIAETILDALAGVCGFVELSYTRDLEADLDAIAEGTKTYVDVVGGAHGQLSRELGGLAGAGSATPLHECPQCEKPMRRRMGPKGAFWGCSGYPECKTSFPDVGGAPGARSPSAAVQVHRCPECSRALRHIVKAAKDDPKKKGWNFWGCTGFPDCKATFDNVNDEPKLDLKRSA